ncbi:hypothetical protein BSKO_08143 [Bryopsis sp. KO-2023]|nr:hypothetical protein BSKO_08143 [Bryopsis sp. KO-2023]
MDKTALTQRAFNAASVGDVESVIEYLESDLAVDVRSVFQTCLIHIAAKDGRLSLLKALVERGADVNALDYGGMRRTPLHWACQKGHVKCVEVLVAAGADTTAQGKGWAKLVQGQECGEMVDCRSPFEHSAASLCSSQLVRLALEHPTWTPEIHKHFPSEFKEVCKDLVMCVASHSLDDSKGCSFGMIGMDQCREIISRLAYPLTAWLDAEDT